MLKSLDNVIRRSLNHLKTCNKSILNQNKLLTIPNTYNVSKIAVKHNSTVTKILGIQGENKHAFKILNKTIIDEFKPIETYKITEITNLNQFEEYLSQDWRKKSAKEIVEAFGNTLGFIQRENILISDTRFDELVSGLLDNVEKLTADDIITVLTFLSNAPPDHGATAHNYHDIWSALDDVCIWRLSQHDIKTNFAIADLFFKLGIGKIGDFIYELLDKLSRKPEKLSKDDLLRFFFYSAVCRKRPIDFVVEDALSYHVKSMTANELGIVAMGYFKTMTHIRSADILLTMMDKVIEDPKAVDEICMVGILKLVRTCQRLDTADKAKELLDAITPELPRLTNLSLLHVALIGMSLHILHEPSLDYVLQRFIDKITDVKSTRLKDIERLLLTLTTLDYNPKLEQGDVYELMIKELYSEERAGERAMFPKSVSSSLLFLTNQNIYLEDLISKTLDNEFINEIYSKAKSYVPKDLFMLDLSVEIERPNYTGNRIPIERRRKGAKRAVDWVGDGKKTLAYTDKMILDIRSKCEELTGAADRCPLLHLVPHLSKPDILLCYDRETRRFVRPPAFDTEQVGDVKRPKKDGGNLMYFAVIGIGANVMLRYSNKPVGIIRVKERQLRTLGYEPIIVPYTEFIPLNKSGRFHYIKDKIFNCIKL